MKNKLEITEEWVRAINLALNNKKSLYITGKPGTGKSELLKYIRKHTNKNLVVVAPTGIAAVNVQGQTMHSFFRLGFKPFHEKDNNIIMMGKAHKQMIQELDIVIIDEVSMVRADMIDNVNYVLQTVRDNKKYFGGVKMIFIGDLYQLPPVITDDVAKFYDEHYNSPYFFDAHVFTESNFKYNRIELTKVFRQTDEKFKEILNNFRINKFTQTDLDIINKRVVNRIPSNKKMVLLATTNKIADQVNREKLSKIDKELYFFETQFEKDANGNMPTGYREFKDLFLKEGAQVMMTVNSEEWINGSVGIIKKIDSKNQFIIVTINSVDYKVNRYEWKNIKYEFNKKSGRITEVENGKIIQFPMKLSYAITVHKAQGKTLDNAIIDMGLGAFAEGQTYTALSRVRTLEGVYLKKPISESDIMIDQTIVDFENSFDN